MTAPTTDAPPLTGDDLTTRIDGVELLAVGTWDATTGKAKITGEDLSAMIAASLNSHYDGAPLKVGHDDDRFQDAEGNPPSTRDGEPAYGWVENLRLGKDGTVLVGDLVGVPKMLADVMASALRKRSVELVRHERVGGKTFAAVLTGLSLLGVSPPAVKGLADLRALFTGLQPVPERFSLLIEPSVSDTDTDTPPIPQTSDGTTQREPQTFGDDPASTVGVHMALNEMQRKAMGIPDGATPEEIKAALAKLGLQLLSEAEGDTPAAEITTTAPPAPPAAGTVDTPPVVGTPDTPAAVPSAGTAPAAAPAPAVEPVNASAVVPPTPEAIMLAAKTLGLTVMDSEQFTALSAKVTALQADATAGRLARDEQDSARRDGIIREAMATGRLSADAAVKFRAKLDTNEADTVELLDILPAVLPLAPLGHSEQYRGGQPGDPSSKDEAALAARRNEMAQYFNIEPLPASAGNGKA